jgi:hypothetical protein
MLGGRIRTIRRVSSTTCLVVLSKSFPSLGKRYADCESSSTMLTIFGGSIPDLTDMLVEERFSEKWEPRITAKYGLTMAKFNGTILKVERGVDVKAKKLESGRGDKI